MAKAAAGGCCSLSCSQLFWKSIIDLKRVQVACSSAADAQLSSWVLLWMVEGVEVLLLMRACCTELAGQAHVQLVDVAQGHSSSS
jgi:hypothetical protein